MPIQPKLKIIMMQFVVLVSVFCAVNAVSTAENDQAFRQRTEKMIKDLSDDVNELKKRNEELESKMEELNEASKCLKY